MASPSALHCNEREIEAAFENLQVSSLNEVSLNSLMKLLPSSEQMARFGASEGEPDVMRCVRELYLEMLQLPHVYKIIRLTRLRHELPARVQSLSEDLTFFCSLCSEALSSANLRVVLNAIPNSPFLPSESPLHNHAPPAPSLTDPEFYLLPIPELKSKASSSSLPSTSRSRTLSVSDRDQGPNQPAEKKRRENRLGESPPQPPPLPPPPSSYVHSWTPISKRFVRLPGPKGGMRTRSDDMDFNGIEHGYAKLKAAGGNNRSILVELCYVLLKHKTNLMDCSIDEDIPCLKKMEGRDLRSWRQCESELRDLKIEFQAAVADRRLSLTHEVGSQGALDKIDAFIADNRQKLQKLTDLLSEARAKLENLLYYLQAHRYERRISPASMGDHETVLSILLQFCRAFRSTANEIQQERERLMHFPEVDLREAILDEQLSLDEDHFKTLVKSCPTESQIDSFRRLTNEEGDSSKAKAKLLTLLTVPNIFTKLKLLTVRKSFPNRVENLYNQLTSLMEATREVLHSAELNYVVQLTSQTPPAGPFSQENFRGEPTKALDLKLLYKLRSSSLDDLVNNVATNHPELLDFPTTLPHLASGTQAAQALSTIADDLRALMRDLEVLQSEVPGLEERGELPKTFQAWRTFQHQAEEEYEAVIELWATARRQSFVLVDYFHESRVQFPVKQGLAAVLNFVQKFQKAVQRRNETEEDPQTLEGEALIP